MNKTIFTYILLAASASIMVSCEPNNDGPDVKVTTGAFVINEGSFNKNNGSVCYYNIQLNSMLTDPFRTTNQTAAGDIVQSFSVVSDSLGLIVANNSGLVKLVKIKDFSFIKSCEITYPRYSLQINDSVVYVTSGSAAGSVKILNPKTMKITGSIATQNGPENLVRSGNYVFAANSGGWGQDSTVSVIDINTNKVVKNIITGENPINLTVDTDGNVWVLCKGSYKYAADYSTISGQSSLAKIEVKSLEKTASINIGITKDSYLPIQLSISPDKKTIYFTEIDGVYTFNISSKIVSSTPLIKGSFNGMNVNPSNGDIYTFVVTDFSAPGTMYIYDNKGLEKINKVVGINPNGVVFK